MDRSSDRRTSLAPTFDCLSEKTNSLQRKAVFALRNKCTALYNVPAACWSTAFPHSFIANHWKNSDKVVFLCGWIELVGVTTKDICYTVFNYNSVCYNLLLWFLFKVRSVRTYDSLMHLKYLAFRASSGLFRVRQRRNTTSRCVCGVIKCQYIIGQSRHFL